MKKGFYWIKVIDSGKITIGYYESDYHTDGSKNSLPWMIIGIDEYFRNDEVEVLEKISEYKK